MSFHVPVRRRRTRRRMKVEVRMWYVVETWRGGLKSLERTSRPSRKVESDQKAKHVFCGWSTGRYWERQITILVLEYSN